MALLPDEGSVPDQYKAVSTHSLCCWFTESCGRRSFIVQLCTTHPAIMGPPAPKMSKTLFQLSELNRQYRATQLFFCIGKLLQTMQTWGNRADH